MRQGAWNELAIGPANASVSSIALGDLNSDGALDIVLGYKGLATTIFSNNGQPTPSFTSLSKGPIDPKGVALAICRINNDGLPDLVIAAPSGGSQVFLNSYSTLLGHFFVTGPTFAASRTVACGDLNGDGTFDIVGVDPSGVVDKGFLALNDGTGVLSAGVAPPLSSVNNLALGFLDGNDSLDIYASGSVLLNNGLASFTTFMTDPVNAIAIGDLTGDGLPDLIHSVKPGTDYFTDYTPGSNVITVNSGTGGLNQIGSLPIPATDAHSSLSIADVNNDGFPDVVEGNLWVGSGSVALNNGDGSFRSGGTFGGSSGSSYSNDIAIGDLNSDGNLDIVFAGRGTHSSEVVLGDGTGHFTQAASLGGSANTVSIGDVDGNQKLDVLLAGGTPPLQLFLNNGTGGMTPTTITVSHDSAITVATFEDVDHDTHPDIVVGRSGQPSSILHNNGDGTFKEINFFGQSQAPKTIRTADMNGDGFPDLIFADKSLPITIYLNDKSGGFPLGEALCGRSPLVICLAVCRREA